MKPMTTGVHGCDREWGSSRTRTSQGARGCESRNSSNVLALAPARGGAWIAKQTSTRPALVHSRNVPGFGTSDEGARDGNSWPIA